jgi:hypothetical protein
LRPISFSIPAIKVLRAPPPKLKDFPRHIVDEELAARLGGQSGHAFSNEEDYYADLRSSRFGITTKREGWDALRHYEIAACAAVPCFRDLDRKPATCAPFGLDAGNSITYHSAEELLERVAQMGADEYGELQAGALAWAQRSTTEVRARELLESCGLRAPPPALAS